MPKIKNRDRLIRRLQALPKLVKDEIRPALAESADEISAMQKRLAPVLADATHDRAPGTLRDSIGWAWDGAKTGAVLFTKATVDTGLRIFLFAGSLQAYYARWVEFGTRERAPGAYRDEHDRRRNAGKRGHHATKAEPFFYVAFRALKKTAMSRIRGAVKKAFAAAAKKD